MADLLIQYTKTPFFQSVAEYSLISNKHSSHIKFSFFNRESCRRWRRMDENIRKYVILLVQRNDPKIAGFWLVLGKGSRGMLAPDWSRGGSLTNHVYRGEAGIFPSPATRVYSAGERYSYIQGRSRNFSKSHNPYINAGFWLVQKNAGSWLVQAKWS